MADTMPPIDARINYIGQHVGSLEMTADSSLNCRPAANRWAGPRESGSLLWIHSPLADLAADQQTGFVHLPLPAACGGD